MNHSKSFVKNQVVIYDYNVDFGAIEESIVRHEFGYHQMPSVVSL